MKLKYYLKGLGIGMIIAALLMGIATGKTPGLTDEEIIIRAKELGMVEQKTLADTIVPTMRPAETMLTATPEPNEDSIPSETDAPIEQVSTTEPTITEAPIVSNEVIEFEIFKGESSNSVTKRLEELGLIKNREDYNNYLCNNGYDRKIHFGTYQLKSGMSVEEITKIITKSQ